MEFKSKIEYLFIAVLIGFGVYLMYLASGTQMLGEDEAVYYSLAQSFTNLQYPSFDSLGRPENFPVFVSLIYSAFFSIFGPSLFLAKAITAFFGLLTLLIVYVIGKKFSIYYGFLAAVILLSMTSFTHQNMIAYVEIPIAFFSALFAYFLLEFRPLEKNSTIRAVIIGAILGLAYYTKFSALVLVLILFLHSFTFYYFSKNKKYLKLFLMSIVAFVVMISPFLVRNLYYFQYPFFEGLNLFFKQPAYFADVNPKWLIDAISQLSPVNTSIQTYSATFGWVALALGLFGLGWLVGNYKVDINKTRYLFSLSLVATVFILIFNWFFIIGYTVIEPRYLSIIFPQVALLGGFFLWQTQEKSKYLLPIVLIIIFFGLFNSVGIAQATNSAQRYPNDYLDALKWIKTNTDSSDIIFTAYGGSLQQFSNRQNLWIIKEFPDLMRSQNSTLIYQTLKDYNVSYILIWQGILAQDYIIPQSNLLGAFTVNFLNVVSQDTQHFVPVYSNSANVIYRLNSS